VAATGSDAYTAIVSWGEIDPDFAGRKILLAVSEDGRSLAADGPRLVTAGDRRGGRYVGATALATSPVDTAPAFRFGRAYALPFPPRGRRGDRSTLGGLPAERPEPREPARRPCLFDAFARLALASRTVSRRSPTSRQTP
jgi:hypothetical protein